MPWWEPAPWSLAASTSKTATQWSEFPRAPWPPSPTLDRTNSRSTIRGDRVMEEGPEPHEWVEKAAEEHHHGQDHGPEGKSNEMTISAITAAVLAVLAAF